MSSKPLALSIKVVILDRAGRCLVLKRSTKSKSNTGKWDFPGGKAELGEKFDQALLREVKEETALKITLQHLAGGAESETPTRRVVYLIMQARIKSGKVPLERRTRRLCLGQAAESDESEFGAAIQSVRQRVLPRKALERRRLGWLRQPGKPTARAQGTIRVGWKRAWAAAEVKRDGGESNGF